MRPVVTRGLLLLALGLGACSAPAAPGDPKTPRGSAGMSVSESASERELGMPILPGAQPQADEPEDKTALSFGLWGGGKGLRIAVRKLRTPQSATEVVAFYRQALSVHGPVLECLPGRIETVRLTPGDDARLRCDDHRAKPGTVVLAVGTPRNQRVVAVQAQGHETHFQLVRLALTAD